MLREENFYKYLKKLIKQFPCEHVFNGVRQLQKIFAPCSPNSTGCVTSRHDTTRYLAHVYLHMKTSWRALSRLSDSMAATRLSRRARQARLALHVFRASPQRGLGWTWPPHFSRSCSWDWCKSRAQKNNLYTRALLLLPCWNKHGSTLSTCHTDVSCRVETWRDESSEIWVYDDFGTLFGRL